jgi:hypothetical protein
VGGGDGVYLIVGERYDGAVEDAWGSVSLFQKADFLGPLNVCLEYIRIVFDLCLL